MADLPSRWPTDAPTSQRALDDWLEARTQDLAAVITTRLVALITKTTNAYIASLTEPLTASGDSAVFDEIPDEWRAVVATQIVPATQALFLSGSVNAWIGNPLTDTIPETIVQSWIGVVNTQSVDYLATASNRLVAVGDDVWAIVRDKVADTVATGATTDQLRREIQTLVDGGAKRAETIARTEVNAAYLNGQRVAVDALGEYGPLEKQWRSTLDDRTRGAHRLLDDVVVPYDEYFTTDNGPLIGPHDPSGSAAEVVNCRCRQLDLYAGTARPDGSIVGTDPLDSSMRSTRRDDVSDAAWVYDPWADWSG